MAAMARFRTRLVLALTAAVLILALPACGGGDDAGNEPGQTSQTETTETETTEDH